MPVEDQVASTVSGSGFLKSDKTHPLTPDKARYLAQQLVMVADHAESSFTETDLLVPFSQNGATQLCLQRLIYKQQYSIKFTDLNEFASYVVSLSPNKARYLAQQLFMAADRSESNPTETDLLVPFSQNGITQLYHQKFLYEQQYSIELTDLGNFVSHVVSQRLQEVSCG